MEAEEIMNEECAGYLRKITMTYGLPPREGSLIKLSSMAADAILLGLRVATPDELHRYFQEVVHSPDTVAEEYAEHYRWLVSAFLYKLGKYNVGPFSFDTPL